MVDPALLSEAIDQRDRLARRLDQVKRKQADTDEKLAALIAVVSRIQDQLTVYQQADDDTTRGWCGDLSTYLRGAIGIKGTVDPEDWALLEGFTGKQVPRFTP